MSTVFNNELQLAIKKVYTQLEDQELIQKNLEKGAKLGLYYAHGATDKATDKLTTDQGKSQTTGEQLHAATNALEVCNNIVTAATAAATDARNTNSLASTAAVNIQAAANSLTDLWGQIASALAIATAKDDGSKLWKLVNRATFLTQKASENAEDTTLSSMNTTIEAAQSRAAVSLNQAKTLAKDVGTLIKALDTNFEALQAKIVADTAALAEAANAENEQAGVYQTALEEEKAMVFSENYINQHINHNLQYTGTNDQKGERFSLSFDGFAKYASFLETTKDKNGDETSAFVPSQVVSEYRLIITQLDDAAAFDIHMAKATEAPNYVAIKIDNGNIDKDNYSADYMTAELASALQEAGGETLPESVNIARDYTGQAVQRGIPYVFFVYAVFNCDYQKEMDDTDGILTLASLPFTLLTLLPAANKPQLSFYTKKTEDNISCSIANAVKVAFEVSGLQFHQVDLTEIIDFRVLLFKENDEFASILNHHIQAQLQILFQRDEAFRLSEKTYLDKQLAYDTAVAIGDNSKIPGLKKELEAAKADYKQRSIAYNEQQAKVENLDQLKISNFFLDADILKSIPVAFALPPATMERKKTETAEVKALEKNLADAEKQLNALLKGEGNPVKEIKKLEKDIEKIKVELDELQNKTPDRAFFEVVNEQGDFTDNYGEPLIDGNSYTALVYSVIKESAPEAQPLFQPNFSRFSAAKAFPGSNS